MLTERSFAGLATRLERLESEFSGGTLRKTMTELGMAYKDLARKEASADLGGDPKFSGWMPTLDVRWDHVGEGKILAKPTARSAGPWTVAEFGRNTTAGPRLTGARTLRSGKLSRARVKRWNGRTEGKGTASRVLERMDREVQRAAAKRTRMAIRRVVGGG